MPSSSACLRAVPRVQRKLGLCHSRPNATVNPLLNSRGLKTLYFKFVWLSRNCCLRFISRKWKNYWSLNVSRTVSQLIMRVHKPKVEYKLALQEKPQGSILTYYYKTKRIKYTVIWKKSIKIVKESKPSFFFYIAHNVLLTPLRFQFYFPP